MVIKILDDVINGIIGGIIAGTIVVYYSGRSNYNLWVLPIYTIFLLLVLLYMGYFFI